MMSDPIGSDEDGAPHDADTHEHLDSDGSHDAGSDAGAAQHKLKNRGCFGGTSSSERDIVRKWHHQPRAPVSFADSYRKNLRKGYRFDYKLRAEFVQDGKPVSQTEVVSVRPGRMTNIEFGTVGVETSLTSECPEGREGHAVGRRDEGPRPGS